jgi:peptidylprolyl isomerase
MNKINRCAAVVLAAALVGVGLVPVCSAKAKAKAAHPVSYKIVTTKTGLKYQDIVVGKGAMPKVGQTVTVDYVGKLTDGTVFDASANHGGTFDFAIGVGQVIPGWDQGVISMKVGGDRKLIIPPGLAYGATGAPPAVPANATLIFDVKLIAVK